MIKSARKRRVRALELAVLSALVGLAWFPAVARAGTLTDDIQDLLDDADKRIEAAHVWKFQIRPEVRTSVIWTDNVFLNDEDEEPFRLVAIAGPGGLVKDPVKLRNAQRSVSDFRKVASRGVVGDYILRSEVGIGLELPVNPDYTKLFDRESLQVLSARVRHHEYADENSLDNTDYSLSTDIFGVLSDLLSWKEGNAFWVRAAADYSRLEEPLDTDIVELQQIGIRSVNFRHFERVESSVRADAGYDRNRLDASIGGEWYRMRLEDQELRQGEYDRTNVHALAGYDLPWFQDKHVYARGDLDMFRPSDRAVGGTAQALNDGDRLRVVAGVDGNVFSKKVAGRLEAGYMAWDPDRGSGLSGDTSRFNSPVGKAELAYQPWSERKTTFQLAYERTAEASAISNFNSIHRGTLSVRHPIQPGKLDGDMSFGVTTTRASEGPDSKLFDFGVGVTYHWFKQVDVTLRYALRINHSDHEIEIQSSFVRGGREFIYVSRSNGDFTQNVLELGLDIGF